MKNIPLIVFLIVGFLACDPVTYTTTSIANETSKDARVVLYGADSTENLDIPSNERFVIFENEASDATDGPLLLDLENQDSVFVFFPEEVIIKFYPDSSTLSSGKNIYNSDDWVVESNKNDYDIIFRITEEDLADAQD